MGPDAAAHYSGPSAWLSAVLGRHAPLHSALAAHRTTIQTPLEGAAIRGVRRPFEVALVPMFFALSGFLVAGSALRTRNVVRFLGLRGLRIFPALLLEVLLSAVVLGGVFTTLPLSVYFRSPGFFRYFGNAMGWITFTLPGVFQQNPSHQVNVNLWTLPAEFDCYLITAALMMTTLFYNRRLFTVLLLMITAPLAVMNLLSEWDAYPGTLFGHIPVYYFLVGVAFFHWRDRIPHSAPLFVTSCLAYVVLSMSWHTVYIYPVFLVYATVYLGTTKLPSGRLLKSGDYSYGCYLYGFPICQAIWAAAPMLREQVWPFRGLCFLGAAAFAFMSWHLVEKHALKLRVFLSPRSAAVAASLHPDLGAKPSCRSNVAQRVRVSPVVTGAQASDAHLK